MPFPIPLDSANASQLHDFAIGGGGASALNENDLAALLARAADLATENGDGGSRTLALLFRVLADEPSEIAALRAPALVELADRLHPDGDGRTLCRAVAAALAQFKDEENGDIFCDACETHKPKAGGECRDEAGHSIWICAECIALHARY